jgi:hypothetical protein
LRTTTMVVIFFFHINRLDTILPLAASTIC